MTESATRGRKDAPTLFREFIHHYQWIHLCLGLIGNTAFVIGSIFLLWKSLQIASTWLFIIGSGGMFVGAVGSAIVKYDESKK